MLEPKVFHFTLRNPHSLLAAWMKFAGISAALIPVLLGSTVTPAGARTEVRGQPDALELRAENASTREVLEALAASFKLTYKLPPNIDHHWNGIYSGSLNRVLARILRDTNYFIKSSDDGVEVVVLRARGEYDAIAGSDFKDGAESAENSAAPPTRATVRLRPASPLTTAPSPPPLTSYLPDN